MDYYTGSAQWHTMWTGSKYLGQLERTPQTPGDYQLEVYFNRQLVRSMTFTHHPVRRPRLPQWYHVHAQKVSA